MPVKTVEIPSIGPVQLHKRKGARNVRITIGSNGTIRVTIPIWAPYKVGIEFAVSKSEWIQSRKPLPAILFNNGQVGKAHHLQFAHSETTPKIRTRIKGQEIWIFLPMGMEHDSPEAQAAATSAAIRALKLEATALLPQRLKIIAEQNGFSYRSVAVKRLKGRWGSCNQQTDIILNCFLMQLPWHLIDYVILHELTHTKIMAHGTPFWTELGQYVSDLKEIRKEIRQYQPILQTV
jgi:predicted metal-dependent hydrolase